MILIDQDLDPHPAHGSAAHPDMTARPAGGKHHRLPSQQALAQFLRAAQAAVRLRGQVTVLLTSDKAIRGLNRRFRQVDRPTDVLSFPAPESAPPAVAGDIAISVPTAARQAAEQRHSLSSEVKILILHGLLHLAGYDHESDNGRMARRERVLRAKLRLPLGLIERSEGDGFQGPQERALNEGNSQGMTSVVPKKVFRARPIRGLQSANGRISDDPPQPVRPPLASRLKRASSRPGIPEGASRPPRPISRSRP
jgi:probable rRNA maturation factor